MKIVNIGIVAHVDAGKTTLTERLCLLSGALREAGSVDEGTARTDFLPVERARGISVRASSMPIVFGDVRLNLIDTPGHVDFIAEVERALSVLDAAVLVLSAVEGVQAQTELLFKALCQTRTAVFLFINKIDRVGSDTAAVFAQIQEKLTRRAVCFSEAGQEGSRACMVVNQEVGEEPLRAKVAELLAEEDEAFFERYLSGVPVSDEELLRALRGQIAQNKLFPVFCGSASLDIGVLPLLRQLAALTQGRGNRPDGALSGVVYRVTHDKLVGRIAHVRLFGGTIRPRDAIRLSSSPTPEKVTQLRRYMGGKFSDIAEVSAGDIAALCGLNGARVSDIVGEAHEALGCHLAVPLLRVRALPAPEAGTRELLHALEELAAEDPQLALDYVPEEDELDICITGAIQLEVLQALLWERYALHASFSAPTVIYKETPARTGRGYDAYTMPKPCWAIIELRIEPLPRGAGYRFASETPNTDILYRYQNHIETELPRALKQGLFGWEVTDLSVTLTGGEHHHIHTHPMDFFLATPLALMDGLQNTQTKLLEPMQTLFVAAPEEYAGKIIGDLIAMRGTYDSPVFSRGKLEMQAKVPVATSLEYAVRLSSLTGGRGVLSARFCGYEECPAELGKSSPRRGVDPRDRDRWILSRRGAL